jgi:hypothetical protein
LGVVGQNLCSCAEGPSNSAIRGPLEIHGWRPGMLIVGVTMFRVSHQRDGIDAADTIERGRRIVQGQPPGRYDVDEIRADPFPSGHTSRAWGRMIRNPDGRNEDEPWPWD